MAGDLPYTLERARRCDDDDDVCVCVCVCVAVVYVVHMYIMW